MMAYLDNIPRIRAQRMLDAAQVAVYPHLTANDSRSWWESNVRTAMSGLDPSTGSTAIVELPFSWDGVPMGVESLRRKMGSYLGRGLQG